MLGHLQEHRGNATNYRESQPSEMPAPYSGRCQGGELWRPQNIAKHRQEPMAVSNLKRLLAETAG